MNAPTQLVLTSATHLLHRAGQLAEDIFSRSIGDLGITARQYVVLSAVDGLEDPSQTTLCQYTGIDRATLADIVRRLVERGLLMRRRTLTMHACMPCGSRLRAGACLRRQGRSPRKWTPRC